MGKNIIDLEAEELPFSIPASQGGTEEGKTTAKIKSERGVPDQDGGVRQRGTSSFDAGIVNKNKSEDMEDTLHHGMNEDRNRMENQNEYQKQLIRFNNYLISETHIISLCDQDRYWNDLDRSLPSTEYNNNHNFFTQICNPVQNGQYADNVSFHTTDSGHSSPNHEGFGQPPATARDDGWPSSNTRLTSKYRRLPEKNGTENRIPLWKKDELTKNMINGVIPHETCHSKSNDNGRTIPHSAHRQIGITADTHDSQGGHDSASTSSNTAAPATREDDSAEEERGSADPSDCGGSELMGEEGRTSLSEETDAVTGKHCAKEPCLNEYKDDERSPKTIVSKQDINNNPRHRGFERLDAVCSKEEDVTSSTNHAVSAPAETTDCGEKDLPTHRHSQGKVPPERRHSVSEHVVSGQSERTHESDTANSEEENANCLTQKASLHREKNANDALAKGSSVLEQEVFHVENNSGESVEPDTEVARTGGDSREQEATVTFGTQTSSPSETADRKTAGYSGYQQLRSTDPVVKYIITKSSQKENCIPLERPEPQRQIAAAATHAEENVGSFPEEHTPGQRAAPRMVVENSSPSVKTMPDCDMHATEIQNDPIPNMMRLWQGCTPTSKDRNEIDREDSGDAGDDLKRDEPLLERGSQQASQHENPTNRFHEEVPSGTEVSIQPYLERPRSEKRAITIQDFKTGRENRKAVSRDSSRHVQKHAGPPETATPTQTTARSKIDVSGMGETTKAVEKAANAKSPSEGRRLEEVHPTVPNGEDSQDSNSPALLSQSENSSRKTSDNAISEALATEPEPQGADSPGECRSGEGGVSGRTPENAESRGGVSHDDSPSDVAQCSPPGRLQEDEAEHTVTSAVTSVVYGGSVTLSTEVQPQRSVTARKEGLVESKERLKNAVTVQNIPDSEKKSHLTSQINGSETNTGDVSVEEVPTTLPRGFQPFTDSPTEQQPTSGKGMGDDNQTTSPIVRAEESAPTSNPSGVQTEEALIDAGSADEVPESHSFSNSGGDLYSDTETGDSRPLEPPFLPMSEIERVKESDSNSYRETPDPLDSDSFRNAGEKLHDGVRRDPDLIIVSLATVRKSKQSSRRIDERTQPFSTSDMQYIHADRCKKIQQFSPQADRHQRSEETLSKRRRDEEDIGILWQTIHNLDRFFSSVVVTLPFFPRDVFPPVNERMRLESMRLASFHTFPHGHLPSTLRLANAGFFYTGQEDTLACHFCGVTFRCDRAEVDPYALHRERNPECPLVRGTENRNLYIQDEQRQALSGRDITGDESNGALVSQQVQDSRGALNSAMTTFVDDLGATTNQTAATTVTVQIPEPLTAPSGDNSPTAQAAEARCTLTVGNTNTPLSPGPRTNESGYFSANGPLSEPRSNAEQGQSLTTGDLSREQSHGLDSAPSTVYTAPPGSGASHTSGNQAPPRQPPEDGTRTTADVHTRNSSSPLEMSRGPQGPSSSTSQRQHQSRAAEQRSENTTASTHLNDEPRVEAGVLAGASRDPVVSSTAVSSPPLRSEGVPQFSHLAARPLPQMVYAMTETTPTLLQDNLATPPATADSAHRDLGYDPSRALHRQYTDLGRRERSFQRWPDTHGQSPEELAVAGFFYTGIGDCVRCHYCGLGLKDWDPEDRAMDEHVRWRSSCGYLQAVLGPEFIAMTLARLGQRGQGVASARSETSESVAAGLASQTTGVGGPTATDPRADNSDITREAETLMTSPAAQAARAMGFPDDVIRQSIVALLRTRAGRNAVKGQNVIHTILYLRERGQVPEITEPTDSETNNDNDDDNNEENTSGSTSANSSPQRRTLPRSPSVHNNPPAVQPAVSQGRSGQQLQVYHVRGQHGDSRTSLQSSGSSMSSSSSSSSSGSSSSGSSWSSGDSGFASGSSSEDETSNGRGAQRPSSGCSTRLPTITEGATTREDLRRLEQENQELMERRRCKICLDNDVSILFLPCGHLVCCAECAPALRRCPMCRKRITGTVHTKLPPSTNQQGQG